LWKHGGWVEFIQEFWFTRNNIIITSGLVFFEVFETCSSIFNYHFQVLLVGLSIKECLFLGSLCQILSSLFLNDNVLFSNLIESNL